MQIGAYPLEFIVIVLAALAGWSSWSFLEFNRLRSDLPALYHFAEGSSTAAAIGAFSLIYLPPLAIFAGASSQSEGFGAFFLLLFALAWAWLGRQFTQPRLRRR